MNIQETPVSIATPPSRRQSQCSIPESIQDMPLCFDRKQHFSPPGEMSISHSARDYPVAAINPRRTAPRDLTPTTITPLGRE